MSIRQTLLYISFAISFSSCSKNNAVFQIDSYLELTLIAGTSTDRVFGFEKEVIFPYETELAANSDSETDINAVKSSYGLVYPKFEANTDLSFIGEITIDVLNPDDLSDDREVFYYEQFNFSRRNDIELFPSLPNIQDFVRNERLILRVEFIFNTPPPRTFDLALELEFNALDEE